MESDISVLFESKEDVDLILKSLHKSLEYYVMSVRFYESIRGTNVVEPNPSYYKSWKEQREKYMNIIEYITKQHLDGT